MFYYSVFGGIALFQEHPGVKPSMSFFLIIIPVLLAIIPVLAAFSLLQENRTSNEQRVSALEEEIQRLEEERDSLKEKISALEKEASALKEENTGFRQDIEEKDSKIEHLQEEKKEYEDRLKDMEEKLKLYGAAGITENKNQKVAYLTFDDGPSENTEKVLDILSKYKIKATFFVVGRQNMPERYKRILKEGHAIGNHTYSHDYSKIYSSVDAFFEDFDKLNSLLEAFTGQTTDIFRFPGGSHNTVSKSAGGSEIIKEIIEEASKRGYKYFDWNVTASDATLAGGMVPKETIVNNVLSGTKGRKNIIVLMHDAGSKDTTVEALPEIIEGLSAQGYKFGVLSKYVQGM
ncbi:hypothetical protein CDQ84_12980 [Clostridium thermosuccinogenes]|uniref:NodB homology domain-containing protein n=1 Tax=Clostridium thermosuccinogenes TaxID=84032 RepID=A0A2K2FFQ1_9CLOT|nr:hypothetical protein CDO33_00125 [Pseudoclostridium thermosuccinogenes]PNT96054.1 hypothetical protein CDQ85_13020 [Pseudoclostridium thermosuccinogenes]PNT97615.1 hypothetical protein CDQ84_12980 [Pseudoclostridium thermosuccinogenes]